MSDDFCCDEEFDCGDFFMDDEYSEKSGLKMESLSKKGNLVEYDSDKKIAHFFPTKSKGRNFQLFIENMRLMKTNEADDVEIIKKYTFHDTFYCTKVNLLLAADSKDLKTEALYIKQLQNSIFKKAKFKPYINKFCFRGMHMSEKEFKSYPFNETIYIPSFLSTSKNEEKFYKSSNNCLLQIILKNIPNNAVIITEELSAYAKEEEEVLFACYSKFRIIEKRKNFQYKGCSFEYFLRLEHINETNCHIDQGTILMINFLGF